LKKINVEKSLKTEFLGNFIIALIISLTLGLFLFYFSNGIYTDIKEEKYIDERQKARDYLLEVVEDIENREAIPLNSVRNNLESRIKIDNIYHLNIVDETGAIIFNGGVERLDY